MAKEEKKPKVPKQREEDQKGGGGRLGQTPNRELSTERGGKPYKYGAGDKKKPQK